MRRAGRISKGVRRPQLLTLAVALALFGASLWAPKSSPPMLVVSISIRTNATTNVAPYAAGEQLAVPVSHVDCAKVACLNLSFDDGPNPITTPQILSILEQYHVHADFFVVGMRAATMPAILQREYQDGDEIGNHSWSHPDLTTLTPAQVQAQITQTQAAVAAAGVPAPRLFRPPYGAVNAMVKSQVPLTLAMWNVDPEDWNTADPSKLAQKVMAQAKPGGIIDLHDIDSSTVAALPAILQSLKGRFQLVTMSQMFDLAPGQHGEFFGR